jgi:orotate phosphoribosyltransferase
MNLFQSGRFKLHSGRISKFKIECDALADTDWETIADIVGRKLLFSDVIGIPTGGTKLAEGLEKYAKPDSDLPILIVDDVFTSGKSMEKVKTELGSNVIGIVLFARTIPSKWITPIFQLYPDFDSEEALEEQ